MTRKNPDKSQLLFDEKISIGLLSHFSKYPLECGCDEAGRGCLAGPVVAAAVILPLDFECSQLKDSKQLTENQRDYLRPIIEQNALCWAVAECSNTEIDLINILKASIQAMHRAINKLSLRPEFLIIDGNRFDSYPQIHHQTIVKGDSKYMSIAAASVLAKTYRDEWMKKLHTSHPEYGWDKNKGYPTKEHRNAIAKFGATPFHRMSFNLLGDVPVSD